MDKYKIMIADDEGIVLDALEYIIQENFKDQCLVERAKSGRQAIEVAERFRPDIAFFDIQMPGINGIEAMKKIRIFDRDMILIVISAFDYFSYAQESIQLGALAYINKPLNKEKIIEILIQATKRVKERREKRSRNLDLQEKMNAMLPLIESSFIQSLLYEEVKNKDYEMYQHLLEKEETSGFVMILSSRESQRAKVTERLEIGARLNMYYEQIKAFIKQHFNAAVGPLVGSRIQIYVFETDQDSEYSLRLKTIEKARRLVQDIYSRFEIRTRIGIGAVQSIERAKDSYKQASHALGFTHDAVAHVNDLPLTCQYEENYPIEIEKQLFKVVAEGNEQETLYYTEHFFNWMIETYPEAKDNIRLKILEFVLQAEYIVYANGGMTYHFLIRETYLSEIMSLKENSEILQWFKRKMHEASQNIKDKKIEKTISVVEKTKNLLQNKFSENISLEEVAQQNNMSPYYFSKLFKAKEGITMIEYLTNIRLQKAKAYLESSVLSIKEISIEVGYLDPNYFSRLFKKKFGLTPTEYKEQVY